MSKVLYMVKSLEDTASKWKQRAAESGSYYQSGVENPTKDWEAQTKKGAARYKAELAKAMAEGRFEKGVAKAGTAKWKKGATEKGTARWAQGVAAAEDEYRAAMGSVLAIEESLQKTIQGMPDTTLEQRIARSAAWQKAMAASKKG